MRRLHTLLSSRRSSAAALLLALFVAAQAYVTVHHAVVAHEVCPIDGELAHAEHASHAAVDHDHGHDAAEHDADESEGPLIKAAGESDDHEDEHCSVPTVRDERTSLIAARPPTLASFGVSCAPVLFRTQDAERQVPVFRLAPKQSPPRA